MPLRNALGYSDALSKETAERELDCFGLSDRASAMPNQLSGGMRQRAVLARCFAAPVRLGYLPRPRIIAEQGTPEEVLGNPCAPSLKKFVENA